MTNKQIGALWMLVFVFACAGSVTMAANDGWAGLAAFFALSAIHQMIEVRS